ncbi:hypothetical protein [Bacillus safensis]|uniref:hypothetical protein n=1 Tax=Bacillus safensis TaxID=561879 RepID=UPI000FF8F2F4|nr:hypothetical protein BAE_19605 [Bacillus aerophilus]
MSWLEFFSSVLTSGSVATIIVVSILRRPLTVILSRVGSLLSLKYKDVLHLDFAKTLDEIEQKDNVIEADQNESAPKENGHMANNTETKKQNYGYKRFFATLAIRSPKQAVYSAWLEIEKELTYLLNSLNEDVIEDIPTTVQYLLETNNITDSMGNIILNLWNLKNDVLKNPDSIFLDFKEANRYCTLAIKMIKQLKIINETNFN